MRDDGPVSLSDFGDLLTEAEAARVLRISRMTLYRMRKDGRINAVRIGRRILYRRTDLLRLLGEADD
jgi:excisionase family DNA binding protein